MPVTKQMSTLAEVKYFRYSIRLICRSCEYKAVVQESEKN